jgi:hypothetical protein
MTPDLIWGVPRPLLLVPLAAFAYAAATFGIKLASTNVSAPAVVLIIGGFFLATVAEAALFRQTDLGVVYLAIIAVETLVVLGIAALIGEGLNFKQMLGAGFVLTGIALVSH